MVILVDSIFKVVGNSKWPVENDVGTMLIQVGKTVFNNFFYPFFVQGRACRVRKFSFFRGQISRLATFSPTPFWFPKVFDFAKVV